jgi:hypothetical protein
MITAGKEHSIGFLLQIRYIAHKVHFRTNISNYATYRRAMAQAVSRRPLTAEARVRSRVSPCEICGGQSGTGTGFFSELSVFPWCSIICKTRFKKLLICITGVAQEALRLWYVRSICCGALHHAKKKNDRGICPKGLNKSTGHLSI